jgi:hypothetical protein
MAKILLVTENLTPTAIRLATALRHQQHQVTLLTSKDEDAELPDGIELMRPFKRWSFSEGLRLAPLIYGMNPEIMHLVLEQDQMKPAQMVLSLIAKTLPHCVLTTSLLHIRQGLRRRNPVRYLLQESDVVTCPSVEALGSLRGIRVKSRRQGRGILPPVLNFSEDNSPAERFGPTADLAKSLLGKNYFVMPFIESEFDPSRGAFRRLTLLAAHRHVVLLGSQSSWTLRERKKFQAWMDAKGLASQWTLTGELGQADLRRLLSHAESFVMAGLSLSPMETTEYFLRGIQAGATLVLDNRQSSLHSDLWRHGENCWILPHDEVISSLQGLLGRGSLRRPQTLPENMSLQRDLIDAPLNELNRLYNKALSHKHIL